MPVIFAIERAAYLSDQETDLAIRQEVGAWQTSANAGSLRSSMRYLNTDTGPGSVTYRFEARQFHLMGVATDGGFWTVADVLINGVSVAPYPSLATGTSQVAAGESIAWFKSTDYGAIVALEVTIRECPGSRGIFDNGVKLIF